MKQPRSRWVNPVVACGMEASGSPPGSGDMISVQLRWSRFSMTSVTGAPVVRPARTVRSARVGSPDHGVGFDLDADKLREALGPSISSFAVDVADVASEKMI